MTIAVENPGGAAPRVSELPYVRLHGLDLHAVTEPQAVDHVMEHVCAGRGGWVITPNLDHLRRFTLNPEFAGFFKEAELVVCDGMPLVWACGVQGTPLPERVAGADLIWSLSEAAAERDVPIYLLGGDPGAAEGAGRVLRGHYPALRIVGVECPPRGFDKDEAAVAAIAERLQASQPGIVFVALGSPKQEQIIARIRHVLPKAWFIGVGISFSFVSGRVKRAPKWMRRHGLEWLHRLMQEPRRLAKRYLIDDLPFLRVLMLDVLARRMKKDAVSYCPPAYRVDVGEAGKSKAALVWALCLLMILLAHGPLLAYGTMQLWWREAYQFFPFAWFAALVLALRLRKAEPGRPSILGGTLLLMLGMSLLLLATASWTWALAMIALPINVAAVVLALGGRRLLRTLVPAIMAYLTTVPPPFGLDSRVLTALRQVAVVWSGKVLDTLGVLHVVSGNLIEIPGHRLFVSEACSGIHSTVSALAFAVIAAMFLRRGALHTALLALLAVVYAIVGNVIRIAAGTALLQWCNYDIISGWKHETAGMLIFGFCVALILSTDQLLAFLLRPMHEKPVTRRTGPVVWPRVSWPICGLAAMSLAAAAAGAVLIAPKVTWSAPHWGKSSIPPTAKCTLPDAIGPWTRTPIPPGLTAETEAVKTDLWPYSNGRLHVVVALDYPYPQYHDLALCYQVQGWNVTSRRFVVDALGPSEELELNRSTGNASLIFASFDERGRWLVANQNQSLKEQLIRRFTDLDRPEVDPRPNYQMQLLTNRSDPLSADDREQMEGLFREVRGDLARQIQNLMAGH